MADGRGGYRKPERPAAVSNPQSGARTDGGPADKQPIRTPTGGAYGEAQALTEQQQGAPLAAGATAAPGAGGPPSRSGPPPAPEPQPDLFRSTERPGEAMPEPIQGDIPEPETVLRAFAAEYPSPWILRMLRKNIER